MAKVALTASEYRQLVRLLADSAGIFTVNDRQNLLLMAGLGEMLPYLHFDSAANAFAGELVRVLQDRGTLEETGQPALVSLLRVVREIVVGDEKAVAFVDELLAPYPGEPYESAFRSQSAPQAAPPQPTSITYYQNFYNSTIAQGTNAVAQGDRSVIVQGDNKGGPIVTGDGSSVASGNVQSGGIRIGKIDAKDVTVGARIEGDVPADMTALAKAAIAGNITVEEILNADVVTVGLNYVKDPQRPTVTELQQEIEALKSQVEVAATTGALPDRGAAEDVVIDLDRADIELAKPEPDGTRVVHRLKGVVEVLSRVNEASDSVQGIAGGIGKLLPYAIALLATARRLFGG